MSYLDDPRVYFAAERTMLAWHRTAIALIGLGFVVERFGLFIRTLATPVKAVAASASDAVVANAAAAAGSAGSSPSFSLIFGVLLLAIGAAIALVSGVQFRRFITGLSDAEIPPRYFTWFGPAVSFSLAAIALGFIGWLVATH